MKKVYYFGLVSLLLCGIFFFHSCAKDNGKLAMTPFNFTLSEGFENSTNLPAGWTLWNPDKDAQWQICTTAARTGYNCLGFNNCSGNGTTDMTGKRDRCITPVFDFTKATSVSISFDVAYAVLQVKNILYTDSLAVYASADGGNTWSQIYLKGGMDLTNIYPITTTTPCWEPASPTDWRTDKIDATIFAGKSKVMFAFENRSDWGEWIFIDNVSIVATNGGSNCDNVTYTKNIQPIIQANCAIPGCHVPGGTIPTDLGTYAGLKAVADNGLLRKRAIDGNPSYMPPTGKLSAPVLGNIRCWLEKGALNN